MKYVVFRSMPDEELFQFEADYIDINEDIVVAKKNPYCRTVMMFRLKPGCGVKEIIDEVKKG